MKNCMCFILFYCLSLTVQSQDILGQWKTVDDETGAHKCIVDIYEENGKIFGKVIEILEPFDKNTLCQDCEGDKKDKPILGMVIINELEKQDEYYKNGTIFDAENGKEYKCRIKLIEETGKLQVRGYIAFLYLTQYWIRHQ
ncbi:DUF2147 domain-containing protein [Algibacter amylolyticus]|uniref:DUF2147 domain-containing protein n=1 Tax=Algibacter amylolyticus TaxID=1608400 RepID=A0A5M7B307_9FLAO|nr:DUF2147 domain-containing protein [Algibacter amylolyticus]KAA5821904.1 DUF2147 domain-containing protein [Algibacter amylolyticus]MBB5269298.1 uncharacterized protein (DUF2147 family) [Algibacter amylolyticus]TSJ73188.1 DUF2147 domain-containing protein [Algibacter amylolyticus]